MNLPKELITNCNQLVEGSHKKISFKNLPRLIAVKENMLVLSSIPIAETVLKSVNASFRLRNLVWIIGIVIIILAVIFNYWFFLGLIIVVIADRYLAKSDKNSWMFLASILLSIEILVDNFAGWGTAFPTERVEAIKLFDNLSINKRTFWLDYYLVNRDKIEPDIIKDFGPKN